MATRLSMKIYCLILVLGISSFPVVASGQADHSSDSAHAATPPEAPLADQLAELQAGVARLETALDKLHSMPSPAGTQSGANTSSGMNMSPGSSSGMSSGMGMMGMGKKDSMSGKGMNKMDMMKGGGMGMMGMMKSGGMGMGKMGMMKGMTDSAEGMDSMQGMSMGNMGAGESLALLSALPGFPGASHIYHIGQTGFFLDHDDHIELTTEQRLALADIKEETLLGQESSTRDIEEAEQELWVLTAADEPDASMIESKVRELEKLRGDQRLAFIQSVGKAASILSTVQREALLGVVPPMPSDSDSSEHQHTGN